MAVPPAERLTEIEVQLLHLQRQTEQLDAVVTGLSQRLDRQTRRVDQLESHLKDLREKPQDVPIDLRDEKPPHY